jgi:hypothetical protein
MIKVLIALIAILVLILGYNWLRRVDSKDNYISITSVEMADMLGGNIDYKASSVFEPLSVGEWGIASAFTVDNDKTIMGVSINKIYTDEEALGLIKKYGGRKTAANEGTSFVVVEYETTKSIEDAYLNVRVCGLDGNRLVLDGKSYTTRTYDLDGTEAVGSGYDVVTWIHKYAYYEVPNGCKEYMLVFGENIKEIDNVPQAIFLIQAQ